MRSAALPRMPPTAPPDDPDAARAALYALLARLLVAPPDAALRQQLQQLQHADRRLPPHPLVDRLAALGACAGVLDEAAMAAEFAALFHAPGQPVLDPYASRYVAGHLHEKPLALLRDDLRALGLERQPGVGEPEDHLGALFETLRLLVAGGPGFAPRTLAEQQRFFDTHVAPWAPECLHEIAAQPAAQLYRHVAQAALAFLALEQEAFELFDSAGSLDRADPEPAYS